MAKGGDVKKAAPPGYYTAKQAAEKLGLRMSTFRYYVQKGRIKRHVPPLRVEGFYDQKEIEELASELALFLHTKEAIPVNVTKVSDELSEKTSIRIARNEDAQGVVSVLTDRGWPAATAEQRISWYTVNPLIDFVAISGGIIMGYLHAVPFVPDALTAIMSGKKRAWHMTPQDILPYNQGHTYDLYIGIATKEDETGHTARFGRRLIAGFFTFLQDLAKQKIIVRRLYAVSAEELGQKLCKDLDFVQQPVEEGDLFPRYMLDLEKSDNLFARRYRSAIKQGSLT